VSGRSSYRNSNVLMTLHRIRKWKQERRTLINSYKEVPCVDCGGQYPYYVMQFDHLGNKLFSIAKAVSRNLSLDSILSEIKKCDVVCANCHAIRTFERRKRGTSGHSIG